jgi:hypothetical protein
MELSLLWQYNKHLGYEVDRLFWVITYWQWQDVCMLRCQIRPVQEQDVSQQNIHNEVRWNLN